MTAHSARCRAFAIVAWLAVAGLILAGTTLQAQEGSAEAGQQKAATCGACHGADGNSISVLGPSLAGQHASYIEHQLEAYRAEERPNDGGMQALADALSPEDIADVSAYYAAQSIAAKGADPALVDQGERIYRGGIPERGIAACAACHGPSGQGNPLAGYPRVSHQHAEYLSKTLRDYRAGTRRSDVRLNQMMRNVAEMLLDDEIEALATYMQGLN